MHCLRHVLLYAILIPMPSASPLLLLAFTVAAYWAIRPCGYCMTILAILFFSTSPSSPFVSVLSDAPAPPAVPSTPVPYDSNIPERGAFCLNGGHMFDPVLVGYREMQRVWRETLEGDGKEVVVDGAVGAASAVTKPSSDVPVGSDQTANLLDASPLDAGAPVAAQTTVPSTGLPNGYFDLSFGGVGLVLDLGWRRTDEGLRWEVENVRQAAEAKRGRRMLRQRRRGVSPPPVVAAPAAPTANKADNAWLRTPFVGLW